MTPGLLEVSTGSPGVRAVFTTRSGGCSVGPYASLNLGATTGDDPAAVRVNRGAVAEALGFDPQRAVTMRQVHGARACRAGPEGGAGSFTGDLTGTWDADACVTDQAGVALLALGADCPVIAAWRVDGTAVGAIHAGWRGLVSGVVGAGIAALRARAGEVHAAIGPHVGPCCYPVGDDLRARMAALFGPGVVRGLAVDLGLCAEIALARAGVDGARVARLGGCTCCGELEFFSYRRDGGATGRHAAVVVMGGAA